MADAINPNIVTREQRIEGLLDDLDKLLKDPNADHSVVLEQALKIVMMLNRNTSALDRLHVMEQEEEVYARVAEVQGTFNSKQVLVLTIASGVISIGGGLIGMGGVLPGTQAGNYLAGKGLTVLNGAGAAKQIGKFGQAVGGVGQGVGMFPQLGDNASQAERTKVNADLEEVKRRRSDRQEASQRENAQQDKALQQAREANQAKTRAFGDISR